MSIVVEGRAICLDCDGLYQVSGIRQTDSRHRFRFRFRLGLDTVKDGADWPSRTSVQRQLVVQTCSRASALLTRVTVFRALRLLQLS